LILGVKKDVLFEECSVKLNKGDILLLYTDGLTEARGAGAFYGEERVQSALEKYKSFPARDLPGLIVADVLEFTNGTLQDDMALLALRYNPEGSTGVVELSGAAHPSA
jgi:sigma-B regulation protein RsbU (phosphoserine phosphatase)